MSAGEVIASFINQELKNTRERRSSIEARGVTVITTSGVIVTLQMAFFAAVIPKKYDASASVRTFVALSLFGFLTAAALGILVNIPRSWQEVDLDTLRPSLADQHWIAEPKAAQQAIAAAQLHVGTLALAVTNRKGKQLLAAFVAELFGMITLSVAVMLVLAG
jgi:hypothetical protein